MSLSLKDIINLQKKQTIRYNGLKEDMLNKLTDKVSHLAKHGQLKCIYTVPKYIFGYPPYNVTDITDYLFTKLKNEGFCCLIMGQDKLFISWDINDINEIKKRKKQEKKTFIDIKPLLNIR